MCPKVTSRNPTASPAEVGQVQNVDAARAPSEQDKTNLACGSKSCGMRVANSPFLVYMGKEGIRTDTPTYLALLEIPNVFRKVVLAQPAAWAFWEGLHPCITSMIGLVPCETQERGFRLSPDVIGGSAV
ncbi:hypothetical protein CH63R_10989 [Colletotrichum higginsianum IMI 349063]|uniref:Uncharacterized protein n=1 Tax=Colletotrichum higginsianum (strain IMI 349063) TaxID=759273 RepID=A0A1B7Y4B3_COLHI|nr:uncharacterized protein CH63R_10989 [Colletotrichum higginsianum IMI 349063]OBR06869.1 hypothetical protein CH63R_10989 [Colletotrichum higginsianum IMI 349063]